MVGDSLTVGSLPYQRDAFANRGWANIDINAYGSRGITTKVAKDAFTGLTAVDSIRSRWGDTEFWVVALGTNDSGVHQSSAYASLIRGMMDRIGGGHIVMWVDIYLPNAPATQTRWNQALADVAAERPAEMMVYPWSVVASSNSKWLSSDSVHYTAAGYRERSLAVAAASVDLDPPGTEAKPVTSSPAELVPTGNPGLFVVAEPTRRIIDTRFTFDRFEARESRTIALPSFVPSTAAAVVVNVVIVEPDGDGFASLGPGSRNAEHEETSVVNFSDGATTSAHSVVAVGSDRTFSMYVSRPTDVVVDVQGWFATDGVGGLRLVERQRLVDTRTSLSPVTGEINVDIGHPEAIAAIVNVTAIDPAHDGHIVMWPFGEAPPATSSLTFRSGTPAVANSSHVAVRDGRFSLSCSTPTHVAIDLIAVYEPTPDALWYSPVQPQRVLDTRFGRGGWLGPLQRDQAIDVGVAGHPAAIVGTLTMTRSRRWGHAEISPASEGPFATSIINVTPSYDVSNLFVTGLDPSGAAHIRQGEGGGGHALVDVVGCFLPRRAGDQ